MYAINAKIVDPPKEIHPRAVFWITDIGARRAGEHVRLAGATRYRRPLDMWVEITKLHEMNVVKVKQDEGRWTWPTEELAQMWALTITMMWKRKNVYSPAKKTVQVRRRAKPPKC